MINRINLILRAKNITARQFAEEIGIQPSGMSHILGGRNNPSLEFVLKVIRRYPEIDANWLLLGKGEMYASDAPARQPQPSAATSEPADEPSEEAKPSPAVPYSPSLFDDEVPAAEEPSVKPYAEESHIEAHVVSEPIPRAVHGDVPRYAPSYMAVPAEPTSQKVDDESPRVVRMLLVYSDNTFVEYLPR